jgi:hypothetical protein
MFIPCFNTFFSTAYGMLYQFFFGGKGGTTVFGTTGAVACHLFTNNYNPTNFSSLSGFTESTFSGYASTTGVFGALGQSPAGNPMYALGAIPSFQCTGEPGVATSVYGYYLTDITGVYLIGAELFPAPIAIHNGTIVPVDALLTFPAQVCIPYA